MVFNRLKKFKKFADNAIDVGKDIYEMQQGGGGGGESTGHRASDDVELDDGANIPLSSCDGNKKALFIGINYFGSSAELKGCINDVDNIKAFVTKNFGFVADSEHMMTLTDDEKGDNMPTKENIINAFKWLVEGASDGDSLFLHYSGHGGSQKDASGDDKDGMDETIIPVDYESNGIILDDDVYEIIGSKLPKGVRLTAIMDCCHSGSIFDLPYTYNIDGNHQVHEVDNRKAVIDAAIKAGMSLLKGDKKAAFSSGVQALKLHFKPPSSGGGGEESGGPSEEEIELRSTIADIIQFSGCRDDQTSADAHIGGEATGAMSWSLIKAFEDNGIDQSYTDLLGNIRELLENKYQQVPQMSTGHKMSMNTHFKM